MNRASKSILRGNQRVTAERDRRIRAQAPAINRWSDWLYQRIAGAVSSSSTSDEALGKLRPISAQSVKRLEFDTLDFLGRLYEWGWEAETTLLVDVVPLAVWVERAIPASMLIGAGESVGYELWERDEAGFSGEIDPRMQAILDGGVDEDEAKAIIRDMEFGEPTPEPVEQSLENRAWPDGLNVSERIRTVHARDMGQVRDLIRTTMTGELSGASALRAMEGPLRELVGNDPSKTTGMNYRARRIARTEGVRVSQDALHDSWEQSADLLQGIRTFTSNDSKVRQTHRHWHDKLYRTTARGYIADDGEPLPRFPAGANCRCWDTPVLRSDIDPDADST